MTEEIEHIKKKVQRYKTTLLEERSVKDELSMKLRKINRIINTYFSKNPGGRTSGSSAKHPGIPFGVGFIKSLTGSSANSNEANEALLKIKQILE